MGNRRKGREAALQFLYQLEITGGQCDDALPQFWNDRPDVDPALRGFVEQLVHAVVEHREAIDTVIDSGASNWQLDRIARLDLSLLRLAACEFLYFPDVPAQVVINEALEIAHKYLDANAPAFINGVLDRIAREQGLLEKAP